MSKSASTSDRVRDVLSALQSQASGKVLAEMGPRYGIVAPKAFGVRMAAMQRIAKPLGPDHDLAEALWESGWYEARMVACMVEDPEAVTGDQMDRWRADFDNWAITDAACYKLFDRVPHAAAKVAPWTRLNDEYGRRAGFALLACRALHGRGERDEFLGGLQLIEVCATDERNFAKKGVNWALRAIGGKRDPELRRAAREVAERLAASPDRTARWIGKHALRAFRNSDERGSKGELP